MKNIFYKHIVSPKELYNLLSLADSVDKKDLKTRLTTIYRSYIIVFLCDFIFSILTGFLIVSTVDYKFFDVVSLNFLGFAIVLFFIAMVQSFLFNRFIYFNMSLVTGRYIRSFMEEFKDIISFENQKYLNEIYAGLQIYGNKIISIILQVNNIIYFFCLVIISRLSYSEKPYFVLIFIIFSLSFIIIGRIYNKSAINLRIAILGNKPINEKDVYVRTITPGISNSIDNVIVPVLSLYLVYNQVHIIIASLPVLISLVGFYWSFLENIDSFILQKKYIGKLLNYFSNLDEKYVLNNNSYKKQCDYCKTTVDLVNKSNLDKSLILNNFSPKKFSDPKGHADIITFDFKPGIYQIHGKNGIGKSTFLESISISKGSLVEFSEGQAALDGKPLFDPNLNLEEHRKKVKCINSKNKIDSVDENLIKTYSDHKLIVQFLQNILSQKRDLYSEGETSVINILAALSEDSNGDSRVIIIDEMISRIYNIEDFRLRDSVLNLVNNLSLKKNIIAIIVDHVIDVKEATHLVMKEEGLFLRS